MSSKLEERVCAICQTPIPPNRTVCSVLCRNTLNSRKQILKAKIEKVCETCGEVFYLYPSYTNEGRYCSNKCYGIAISGQNNYNYKGRITNICQRCGKTYEVWPHEAKERQFCSKKCSSLKSANNSKRGKSGKRVDLDNLFVRSSWEANYARYLNLLITKGTITRWEYEPDTFEFPIKRGTRFYTPDFKVFYPDETVEYHEVKGWMDKTSQTKLNRMNRYYPDITVILIDRSAYLSLAKQYKEYLPEWEG